MKKLLDTILDYHQHSEHHFQHYAAGPDGLDWNNQPNPFRTFAGSAQLELLLLRAGTQPLYAELYQQSAIPVQSLNLVQHRSSASRIRSNGKPDATIFSASSPPLAISTL